MANAAHMQQAMNIVLKMNKQNDLFVVVSAMSGVTDRLIRMAEVAAKGDIGFRDGLKEVRDQHIHEIKTLLKVNAQSAALSRIVQMFNELEMLLEGVFALNELSLRTKDRIMAYGELFSSTILSHYLAAQEIVHHWIDPRVVIKTNSQFGNASALATQTESSLSAIMSAQPSGLFLMGGFIGSDVNNDTTTLGRGGSDYSAAIVAAAIKADELQIWTDVSGMMTADPRLCINAKVIPHISYQEAMELSHFGAKVIYPPTIQPVMNLDIPVRVKNTFAPDDAGTLIERFAGENEQIVCGLSSASKLCIMLLEGSGMIGIPGFSKRLFQALASEKINVILITQSSSEHSICVAIDEENADKARNVVDEEFAFEIASKKLEPLSIERDLSIVALVGDNMKSHPGISGKMFSALGKNGINIRAIAQGSSEKNISVVIRTSDVRKAINVLHEVFFESTKKQINLFIVGVGNVGGRLIQQLKVQQDFLQNVRRLNVNVVGLANSRQMLLKEEGINIFDWKKALEEGQPMNLDAFCDFISEKNLRNSILVDITADASVTLCYEKLLRKSVSVVACNKTASSSEYTNYQTLKNTAREFNTNFLFETNVGAGLPVIGTLNDLLTSGDEILRIEAVLSGTLTFVFNEYDGTVPFAEIVKRAQDEGYTEPDPRIDLSGIDVMRKILILARESGYGLNLSDITCNGFLPPSCMDGSIADFYVELKRHEAHFLKLYNDATLQNCRLKFVAQLKDGKASVGLQHIDAKHDLYHLYGKDNVVIIYTKRYLEQPLVIKGAGAGAEVTASGIFADIMRAGKV